MKAPLLFPIIFAAFTFSLPTHANGLPGQKQPISISPIHAEDTRIDLKFTTAERAIFLADMRNMLGSIQEILQGIGSSNREEIIEAARRSGNRAARAMPQSIHAKLPQKFRELGAPTHMMFEELAVRAQTDDMDMLAAETAKIMNNCMSCHATFRVH